MQLLRSRLGQSPQTVGQRRRISKCPSARGPRNGASCTMTRPLLS